MSVEKSLKLTAYILTLLVVGCMESNLNKSVETEPFDSEQPQPELPSDSFSDYFLGTQINYVYSEKNQTHDYSENWDFDGDGIKDSIRFEGDGGAHLQFFLVISLSTESHPQYFDWIFTDDPLLQPVDSIPETSIGYTNTNFVVSDFNGDQINDIFINVGSYGESLPFRFEELGLKTREIILHFDQKTNNIVVDDWRKFSAN